MIDVQTPPEKPKENWVSRTILWAREENSGIRFDVAEHPGTVCYFIPNSVLHRHDLTLKHFQPGRVVRYSPNLDDIELGESVNMLDGLRTRAQVLIEEIINGRYGIRMIQGAIRDFLDEVTGFNQAMQEKLHQQRPEN